jgi:predicted dehydrogenase
MNRVRLGFIGAGGIAERHLGVLRHFPDVDIVAFADTVASRAQALAECFEARSFEDGEALLAAGGVDAVYICLPPFAHGPAELDAARRGIPFFVEKPVSLDLETAEAVAGIVAEKSLTTAVGYHWRYFDTVDEAKSFLSHRPAMLASGYWLASTPPPQWWWKKDGSGGQVVEQTTHILDLARHLLGEVQQVFALEAHSQREAFPGLDVATASTINLKFRSAAIATISSTCLLNWGHRIGLNLFGEGFAIELTERDIMVDVGAGRPVRRAEGDPVVAEDRDFIDAVLGRANKIRCPYSEALLTQRLAMAVERSATSGQPVNLGNRSR